jgi:hypothetical protein
MAAEVSQPAVKWDRRDSCGAAIARCQMQKLPAGKFQRSRAPGRLPDRMRANLSDAAGTHHRRLCGWRRRRHPSAADGPMAFGATRPAVYHRESARRGHQYCRRGGRACVPGRLYASSGRSAGRHQCCALRQATLGSSAATRGRRNSGGGAGAFGSIAGVEIVGGRHSLTLCGASWDAADPLHTHYSTLRPGHGASAEP